MRRISLLATGLFLAASVLGCGDSDGDEGASEPANVTESELRTCLEEAGARLRTIEVSFADPPPDFSAAFGDEQATVWVMGSSAGVQAVAANQEALSQLGEEASEDHGPPIELGNVYASPFLGPLSDQNRATIEGCIP